MNKVDKCTYRKCSNDLPYPRVKYISNCGYQLAIMEGYEFQTHKNSNGASVFSERTNNLNLPKGICQKCSLVIFNE